MSDFVTRLVERQAGEATMVHPRTPALFAPPMGRIGPADFSVMDSSVPIEPTRHNFPDSIHASDHGDDVRTHTDRQEGRGASPGSRSAPHTSEEPHRTVAAPIPVVRRISAIVNASAQATPAGPSAASFKVPQAKLGEQSGLNRQHIEDAVGQTSSHSVARMVPPPLVNTRHDAVQSSAAAPPSLVSTRGIGRRTERNQTAATEAPVEVTIGRIELTAVSTAPDTKRKPGARRPAMSLEEYLTRRQGGRS